MRSLVLLFLLTLSTPALGQSTRPSSRSPKTAATQPAGTQGGSPNGDLRFMPADQVFEQMLKPSTRPSRPLDALPDQPVHDKTSSAGSIKPNAPPVVVIREGTMIVDRLGRLSHNDKGQPEFNFESDGKALRDPPMLLLPNLTLSQIEDTITAQNRDLKLRVTGTVTEYKGRNYLLLEKVIVPLDVATQF